MLPPMSWPLPAKAVVGMIHVGALPGTPRYRGSVATIVAKAVREAKLYEQCGLDAIAVENMHDVPYLRGQVGPEITAAMTTVARAVTRAVSLPCGIQILAGANREALAVALAAELTFVRVEGFVFAHVADEGIIESSAGDLLRFRTALNADHIAVVCDLKKKHSAHAITSDVSIAETAKAAEFFLADGVIVTGPATGQPADLDDLRAVRDATSLPLFVGSGVTAENVANYLEIADAVIVGSTFKVDGKWHNDIDADRVTAFMDEVRKARRGRLSLV